MTATVVTIPLDPDSGQAKESGQRLRVNINIDAEVLTAEAAMVEARMWLAQKISNYLSVASPELVVDEGLVWRFEVVLALPNEVQPGSGALYHVGHIRLDAETGKIEDADALAAELRVQVASIAP
jgi:hypothetical protein